MGLAFPPAPFPLTLLAFFGLLPYLNILSKSERLLDINRLTYITFFSFSVITLYWVGSWSKEADPFLIVGGILLLFINPVFFLIPSTLFYFARKHIGRLTALLLLPFFWVAYEYFYMEMDAHFPWTIIGNALPKFLAFIQIADIIGVLGLSLIAVAINVFLFLGLTESRKWFVAAAIFFFLPLSYGIYSLDKYSTHAGTVKAGLIQPNIDPWDKWSQNNVDAMTGKYLQNYFDLSSKAVAQGAEIVIWPETALPVYLLSGPYAPIVDSIYRYVRKNNIYLMTGMPNFKVYFDKNSAPPDAKKSMSGEYLYTTYNSVLLFSPYTSSIASYGKMKLVPFGERVPFVEALPWLGQFIKWNVGISSWNIGRDSILFQANLHVNKKGQKSDIKEIKISSLVCFDSVFPDFVASYVSKGASFIAVVTNDSWYGNSSGPYQHKEISVLRAVENRRSVVRAANGGISCIIVPSGRTLSSTEMCTRNFIACDIPIESKITFYTKHPLIIPLLSCIAAIFIFGIAVIGKIKSLLKK
jgi:apolipoprotein N-acyltransferase